MAEVCFKAAFFISSSSSLATSGVTFFEVSGSIVTSDLGRNSSRSCFKDGWPWFCAVAVTLGFVAMAGLT